MLGSESGRGRVAPKENNSPNTALFEAVKDKSYARLATSVIMHWLGSDTLSTQEKLFLIGVDCLANIELNAPKRSGKRAIRKSAESLGAMMNVSKKTALRFQQSLKGKGVLDVQHGEVDRFNRKTRNKLKPIISEVVAKKLLHAQQKSLPETGACLRTYLDENLLFFRLNFSLLRAVLSSDLKPASKLVWMYCYIRGYCANQKNGEAIFHTSNEDLKEKLHLSSRHRQMALLELSEKGYICLEEYKVDREDSHRKEMSRYMVGILLPDALEKIVEKMPNRRPCAHIPSAESDENPTHVVEEAEETKESHPNNTQEDSVNKPVEKQEMHHQPVNMHHQNAEMSPLSNKYNNNLFDNKKLGEETVDNLPPPCTAETLETQCFDEQRPIVAENNKQIGQREDLSLVPDKTTQDSVDVYKAVGERFLSLFVMLKQLEIPADVAAKTIQQRLLEEEKTSLSKAIGVIYAAVDQKLTQHESSSQPASFDDFLSFLPEWARLLYKCSQNLEAFPYLAPQPIVPKKATQQDNFKQKPKDILEKSLKKILYPLGESGILHVVNYLKSLKNSGDLARNYYRQNQKQLIQAALCFVATWQNESQKPLTREARCFRLKVLARLLREGRFTPPKCYLELEAQQIAENRRALALADEGTD